jgi:hypothetical protein
MYDILSNVFSFGLPFVANFTSMTEEAKCWGYKHLVGNLRKNLVKAAENYYGPV